MAALVAVVVISSVDAGGRAIPTFAVSHGACTKAQEEITLDLLHKIFNFSEIYRIVLKFLLNVSNILVCKTHAVQNFSKLFPLGKAKAGQGPLADVHFSRHYRKIRAVLCVIYF